MNRTAKLIIACLVTTIVILGFTSLRQHKPEDPEPYTALVIPNVGIVTAHLGKGINDHGITCITLTDASVMIAPTGQPPRLMPYSQAFASLGNVAHPEVCDVAFMQPVAPGSELAKLIANGGQPQAPQLPVRASAPPAASVPPPVPTQQKKHERKKR